MKETLKTIIGIIFTAIIGFFLPDIFNALNDLLGLSKIEITPLIQFLSAGFGGAIGYVISGHFTLKHSLDSAIGKLQQNMSSEINKSLQTAIDKSVIPLLLDIKSNDPKNLNEVSTLVGPLIRYLAIKGYGMNTADSIIIIDQVKKIQKELDLLNSDGLIVNLDLHLKTTHNLAEKSGIQYVQIHRHVLDVSKEWSEDWIRFLEMLSKRDEFGRLYILLISEKELKEKRTLIDAVNEKLKRYGFDLKLYTLENLKTTFGKIEFEDYDAIEIFDETIIKTQKFIDGKYVDGSKIKMKILNYKDSSMDSDVVRNIILHSKQYDEVYNGLKESLPAANMRIK